MLKRARWREIEGLFHRALPLSVQDRSALFAGVRTDIAVEAAELISAYAPTGDWRAPRSYRVAPKTNWIGRCLGAYVLQREVGRGGQGAVFMARRVDRAREHRVAVKVSDAPFPDHAVHQRIDAERRVLACLDHPGIPQLLDGGTCEDGVPYVVMEFIQGLPIDAFCERRRLDVDQRLKLLLNLCEAVAHVHGRGVVHGDIKPCNVLVTLEGKVKLVDFGNAERITNTHGLRVGPSRTGLAARALTLSYASPEQLRGSPITIATDIYALGATMYKLLTGCLPLSDEQVLISGFGKRAWPSPLLPSRVALRHRALRSIDASALRGDIDAMVLRALAWDLRRRYRTASALAADIGRILARHRARGHDAARAGTCLRGSAPMPQEAHAHVKRNNHGRHRGNGDPFGLLHRGQN